MPATLLDPSTTPKAEQTPAEAAITCPKCGGATFKTAWQRFKNDTRHVRMSCAGCGAFMRYLPQKADGTPAYRHEARPEDAHAKHLEPPTGEKWDWLGFVRQADGVWRPIARASTLEGCWDALLTTWQRGDLLAMPVRRSPNKQESTERTVS
jgi:hypothetical protein